MMKCAGCWKRQSEIYLLYDKLLTAYKVCEICLDSAGRECELCEMHFTHDCYDENELYCVFCLDEESDEDYVPEMSASDTDTFTSESDTETSNSSDTETSNSESDAENN